MNSPHLDSDESCIQEVIAQFYSFFGRMVQLKNNIEHLEDLDHHTRARILDQLEDIEREYKDNHEWFITRDVQDVRVGVVGTERSLKTALVSLYVEGVLEIEGDEKDGRSKSKITVDGRCKLLLIREETGCPSKQLCQWADVLLLVFSHADSDSLQQLSEFYQAFRELRDAHEAPVLLVGVKDDQVPLMRTVQAEEVERMAERLDKTPYMDVGLSQLSIYPLFAQACRLALSSSRLLPPPSIFPPHSGVAVATCPLVPASSQATPTSYSQPGSGSHVRFSPSGGGSLPIPPASPSKQPRSGKRKSYFGKQTQYSLQKLQTPTAEYGSGRPVPVKEGAVNKKTAGLRAEWKKKYLVLSEGELTYYPGINDYMSMSHGKMVSLQHITVKVPGQRVSSVSRHPGNTNNSTELLDVIPLPSDHSNSTTPPLMDGSLELSYSVPTNTSVRVTVDAPKQSRHGYNQEFRSPTPEIEEFSSSDQLQLDGVSYSGGGRYDHVTNNGRGHNRNSSMDEFMLQQLRTGGISYPQVEDMSDRSATMSRIETRKHREGRAVRGGGVMGGRQGSDDLLSEGTADSTENLGSSRLDGKKRRGGSDRNSMVMERSASESAKDKAAAAERSRGSGGKGHKRQRSWAGNKVLDVETADGVMDSSEFQILSLDGRVWSFDAITPEDAMSWVRTIEEHIKVTISESVSHKRVNSCSDLEKKEISSVNGNDFCADCNSPSPEWCSLNHGCMLCIECSGVHRNLGSHISRIRSLALDDWRPELIAVMTAIGNKASKSLMEAVKPKNQPIHSTPWEEREKFIKAKYIDKEFLAELPRNDKTIAEQLMDAVKTDKILDCLNILAHSSPDDINVLHGPPESWAPLHVACMLGRTVVTQLLIWNGADINILDADKRTPLHYARYHDNSEIVAILLANSCVDHAPSHSPQSSDTGSVGSSNPHLVT